LFKVAVLADDSAGTETHRMRRCRMDSADTRETVHRKLKNSEKMTNLKKIKASIFMYLVSKTYHIAH